MKNTISAKELAQNLDEFLVIDCRGDLDAPGCGERFYEEGHIPTAVIMDVNYLVGKPGKHGGACPLPDIRVFADKIREMGVNNDSKVVVYAEDNVISYVSRLWWLLKYIGVKDVSLLIGGFKAWREAGFEISKEVPSVKASDLSLNLQADLLVDIEVIRRVLETGECTLIDARPPMKFNGEIDEKTAGHLPGAMNVFFGKLFKEDGTLDEERIEKAVAEIKAKGKPTIAYCNSGIGAKYLVNILSDYGVTPRVYAGSLSDYMSYEGNSLEKTK